MCIQTLANVCSSYILKDRQKSNFVQVRIDYTCGQLYVYLRESSLYQNSNTQEHDWPQHDHSAACLIDQDYSSTTFMSLHVFKNATFVFNFLKTVYISDCIS